MVILLGVIFLGDIIFQRVDGWKRFCLEGCVNILLNFVRFLSVEYICFVGVSQQIIMKGIFELLLVYGKVMFCCMFFVILNLVLVMFKGFKIFLRIQFLKV